MDVAFSKPDLRPWSFDVEFFVSINKAAVAQ
jgi:hypothetical protein